MKTAMLGKKVVLITGASSGIGKTCADYLEALGHKVYGASRSLGHKSSSEVITEEIRGKGWIRVGMDVTNEKSVEQGVAHILKAEGRLDAVINSAGYGISGSVEDTAIEEAYSQFETNFFGVLRVCRAVLPIMRKQKSGCIINMSSIAGIISLPFQGLYCASKFALEGMTEALRLEVKPFGIHVVLIEPGNFRT